MNKCGTFSGGIGGPIFDANNFKIIGIQYEMKNDYNGNYAIFLKLPIEQFYENEKKKSMKRK